MEFQIELRNIKKLFGNSVANESIHLQVQKGSIHGIIGENGAGKSTAMKILYGMYPPDRGEILVRNQSVRWKSSADAIRSGIGMVHQHFMLAGPMTVLENILLEVSETQSLPGIPFFLRPLAQKSVRKKLEEISQKYGLPVPLDTTIENLPVGIQQRVEILKLLYKNCEVLILDEPTAVLTPQEILDFFVQLRRLKAEGRTVLLITHKLKEIVAVADRVTVFKAGKTVAHREIKDTSVEELGELMVGSASHTQPKTKSSSMDDKEILQVQNLSIPGILESISLSVKKGEIVGIAGVEGNGQKEFQQMLLNPYAYKITSGEIRICGKKTSSMSPADIRALGVGYLPEDRIRYGILPERPLVENFLLGHQHDPEFQQYGIIKNLALEKNCLESMTQFSVKPLDTKALAKSLSGGNQQKFVVARELWHQPQFVIAAHPTRGVDIGAIRFIHSQLNKIVEQGAGVLLISSELEELMSLSDRILVFYRGKIQAEFRRDPFDEKKIGLAMGGGKI